MPNQPPIPPNIPLINAIKATNAINIAPTLSANCIPDEAPAAAASKIFAGFSNSTFSISSLNFSVCGYKILANNRPAGAAIKEAAIK